MLPWLERKFPGEYAVLEYGRLGPTRTVICATKEEARSKAKEIKRYTLVKKISTHSTWEGNKTLDFLDHFVNVCPNDRITKLISDGVVVSNENDDGTTRYNERAYCCDCGYQVFRRPSDERISQYEENTRK